MIDRVTETRKGAAKVNTLFRCGVTQMGKGGRQEEGVVRTRFGKDEVGLWVIGTRSWGVKLIFA